MKQIKEVAKIVRLKLPKNAGCKCYERSTTAVSTQQCIAMVLKININPGGKQTVVTVRL